MSPISGFLLPQSRSKVKGVQWTHLPKILLWLEWHRAGEGVQWSLVNGHYKYNANTYMYKYICTNIRTNTMVTGGLISRNLPQDNMPLSPRISQNLPESPRICHILPPTSEKCQQAMLHCYTLHLHSSSFNQAQFSHRKMFHKSTLYQKYSTNPPKKSHATISSKII